MIDFLKKTMWNDGAPLEDFMGREGAPAIAQKNLCFGGGGGGAPSPPDYSNYIAHTSAIGNDLVSKGGSLYDWATKAGQGLDTTASTVGNRAGTLADTAAGTYPGLMANWQNTYGPLYQAQADDASRTIKNLPTTEENYAGKYSADVGQAFDATRATQMRTLQSNGLRMPGIASTALDSEYATRRAAAQVAGAEQGRLAARTEARNVTGQAINTGIQIPQVAQGSASLGISAGQQQLGAPESAVSTTAGAYSPSLGYYSAGFPYISQWGQSMGNQYNQQLAQYNANQNSGGGMGALAGAGAGLVGTVAGAYFGGPAGAAAGGSLGSAAGKSLFSKNGGMIQRMANGGAPGVGPGNVVPPGASPSGGAETDDVHVPINDGSDAPQHGAINVGEFIWPKDVVAWRGEQWMQKEIIKARKERQEQTVAKPEMGAISTQAPGQGAPA